MFTRAILLIVVLAGAACATPLERDRAFTDDWAYQRQHEAKTQDPPKDIPLIDDEVLLPPTVLHINEEGKPEVRIGNDSRWSTGVRVHGGDPEVNVRYKVKF